MIDEEELAANFRPTSWRTREGSIWAHKLRPEDFGS